MLVVLFAVGIVASPLHDDGRTAPVVLAGTRIFFSRIRPQEGVEPKEVAVIDDAVLVAAKEIKRVEVVGVSDVQGVLDLAAQKAAIGCDDVTCASEVADALNAPQIVTGALGRVGGTWVLTLTRIDRSSLVVLAREQIQRAGDGPDVVLADVPAAVHRLLGDPDPSPLILSGAITGAAGVVAIAAGGGFIAWSATYFNDGRTALAAGDRKTAAAKRHDGEGIYDVGWGAVVVGALVAVAGTAAATVGLSDGTDAP